MNKVTTPALPTVHLLHRETAQKNQNRNRETVHKVKRECIFSVQSGDGDNAANAVV